MPVSVFGGPDASRVAPAGDAEYDESDHGQQPNDEEDALPHSLRPFEPFALEAFLFRSLPAFLTL